MSNSIEKSNIPAAYFKGLREANGADPDVMEDLGIPMSPESAERHYNSGKEVGRIIAESTLQIVQKTEDPERERWIRSFNLTGDIPYKTPEEQAETSRNIRRVRQLIAPGPEPKERI